MSTLELAQDDLRIAVDVGSDLHHRNLPIAAREGGQLRLRHDYGLVDGEPIEPLDAECDTDLLGKG